MTNVAIAPSTNLSASESNASLVSAKRMCARNSTLPAGPRSGEAIRPRTAKSLAPRILDEVMQHRAVRRRVAHHPTLTDRLAPRLELRLHQGRWLAPPGREEFAHRRQNQRERDEGDVGHHERDRLGQAFQVAGVLPLDHDDARILANLPVQLPAPHIDRVDARRARLQQAVGEAAGTRAEIGADQPASARSGICRARPGSLSPPRETKRPPLMTSIAPAGTGIPGLSTTRPPTRTCPAITSARA